MRLAGPAKTTFVAKMAGAVAAHARMSLAVIVVLAALVIGIYVYYHGILWLGPYAGRGGRAAKAKRKAADAEPGDPETERLIDSINRRT
jgi:putative methionine-R-sulfoxide reductase with GAF domain